MPNIAQVLKAEIGRISRREIKDSLIRVHDINASLKKTVTDLKIRIAALESESKQLLFFQKTIQRQMPQPGLDLVLVVQDQIISGLGRLSDVKLILPLAARYGRLFWNVRPRNL